MTTENTHRWKFFRAGGFDQVKIESGAIFIDTFPQIVV